VNAVRPKALVLLLLCALLLAVIFAPGRFARRQPQPSATASEIAPAECPPIPSDPEASFDAWAAAYNRHIERSGRAALIARIEKSPSPRTAEGADAAEPRQALLDDDDVRNLAGACLVASVASARRFGSGAAAATAISDFLRWNAVCVLNEGRAAATAEQYPDETLLFGEGDPRSIAWLAAAMAKAAGMTAAMVEMANPESGKGTILVAIGDGEDFVLLDPAAGLLIRGADGLAARISDILRRQDAADGRPASSGRIPRAEDLRTASFGAVYWPALATPRAALLSEEIARSGGASAFAVYENPSSEARRLAERLAGAGVGNKVRVEPWRDPREVFDSRRTPAGRERERDIAQQTAIWRRARIAHLTGRHKEALEGYRRVIAELDNKEGGKDRRARAQILFMRAAAYNEAGVPESAAADIEKILSFNASGPYFHAAQLALATLLERQGKTSEARAQYKAVADDRENPYAAVAEERLSAIK
jgi:tetratricopeptide (TPR) repeat protein